MTNKLNAEEMALVDRLCRPDPFYPTVREMATMAGMVSKGLVKHYPGNFYELTDDGADAAIETKWGA